MFALHLQKQIIPTMDIYQILEGNHDAIIEGLLTYDKPEVMANHFANMRSVIMYSTQSSGELPKHFADWDYLLGKMTSFFMAVAIAQKSASAVVQTQ